MSHNPYAPALYSFLDTLGATPSHLGAFVAMFLGRILALVLDHLCATWLPLVFASVCCCLNVALKLSSGDAAGVMVWDENRDYGQEYQFEMGEMVKRDRNHPSIVVWSCERPRATSH